MKIGKWAEGEESRNIGVEQGYRGLSIRDVKIDCAVNGPDTPAMETVWQPDPDELERLKGGAAIVVRLLGTIHPPIMLAVTEAPPAAEEQK